MFLSLVPVAALAHPLGNFTVNHFTRLQVDNGRARINYVVDMAEIPAFQELRSADSNGDGKTSASELDAYMTRGAVPYANGIVLTVEGARVPVEVVSGKITTPPGAGGLLTLRVEHELLGRWVNRKPGVPAHLRLEDTNHRDRLGWHEIVVAPGSGISIFDSSAFSNSISNELRAYPPDMLAAPLDERRVNLSWVVGAAPPGAAVVRTRAGGAAVPSRDRLAELIAIRDLTPGLALLGLLIAATLGAAHALSPGHGKTIVGAYLIGSRGTPRHAAFLGLTVTITHTAGVFALGLLTLFASKYVLPERLFPILSFVSGATVALIGLSLFFRRLWMAFRVASPHSHEHESDGHGHQHTRPPAHTHALAWRKVPFPRSSGHKWRSDDLAEFAGARDLGRAIALSLGSSRPALCYRIAPGWIRTPPGVGIQHRAGRDADRDCLAFVYAGRWLESSGVTARFTLLGRFLPIASSLAIACLGAAICSEAVRQAGVDPVTSAQAGIAQWHAAASGQVPITSLGALAVSHSGWFLLQTRDGSRSCCRCVQHGQRASQSRTGRFSRRPMGSGHTLMLVAVGTAVLLLGLTIPERVAQYSIWPWP
ncbi:MAG: hypothetical protein WKF37_15515 [Bryobacteraceae bacterium]